MSTLRLGSNHSLVSELKRYLNYRLTPGPNLPINNHFDIQTKYAVQNFQQREWLVVDGIVGDATWNALREVEEFNVLRPPAHHVPQPDGTTCWAASTGMLLGRSSPATAPASMRASDGGLLNDSEANDQAVTGQYARLYGLTLLAGQSWLPSGLAELLRNHGPLMINVLWSVRGFVSGAGSSGHMIIIAGIRGTDTAATVRIYDPWPPGTGGIYSRGYARLMRDIPAATYQIYHR